MKLKGLLMCFNEDGGFFAVDQSDTFILSLSDEGEVFTKFNNQTQYRNLCRL